MRSFFIFILQLLFIQNSIAQSLDAKTNSLGSCGLTQTNVWSNLENQAGLANINKFVFGIGSKKQFLLNELNNHTIACAIPIYGGVIGINLNYFGFELYNETKIGLAFGKKLSPSFNIGIQLDYLGTYPGSLGNYAGVQYQIPVITIELPYAGIMPTKDEINSIWRDLVKWLRKNIIEEENSMENAQDAAPS